MTITHSIDSDKAERTMTGRQNLSPSTLMSLKFPKWTYETFEAVGRTLGTGEFQHVRGNLVVRCMRALDYMSVQNPRLLCELVKGSHRGIQSVIRECMQTFILQSCQTSKSALTARRFLESTAAMFQTKSEWKLFIRAHCNLEDWYWGKAKNFYRRVADGVAQDHTRWQVGLPGGSRGRCQVLCSRSRSYGYPVSGLIGIQ